MVPTGGTAEQPKVAPRAVPETEMARELPYVFSELAQQYMATNVVPAATQVAGLLAEQAMALGIQHDRAVDLGARLATQVSLAPLLMQGGLHHAIQQDVAPEQFFTEDLRAVLQEIRGITHNVPIHAGAKHPGAHAARLINRYTDQILNAINDKALGQEVLIPAIEQVQRPRLGE